MGISCGRCALRDCDNVSTIWHPALRPDQVTLYVGRGHRVYISVQWAFISSATTWLERCFIHMHLFTDARCQSLCQTSWLYLMPAANCLSGDACNWGVRNLQLICMQASIGSIGTQCGLAQRWKKYFSCSIPTWWVSVTVYQQMWMFESHFTAGSLFWKFGSLLWCKDMVLYLFLRLQLCRCCFASDIRLVLAVSVWWSQRDVRVVAVFRVAWELCCHYFYTFDHSAVDVHCCFSNVALKV